MKYEIEHLELFFGKAFPCGESEKVLGNQSIKWLAYIQSIGITRVLT